LPKDEEEDKDFAYGPIYNGSINRFGQLPEATRRWLESLDQDKIAEIEAARKFYDKMQTVAKFNKWLIIIMVSAFVGAVSFGEAITKVAGWFSGGKHP